jgi:hypothetical protein
MQMIRERAERAVQWGGVDAHRSFAPAPVHRVLARRSKAQRQIDAVDQLQLQRVAA